jgi:hypothetical protein
MPNQSSRRAFLKKGLTTTSSVAVLGTGFINLAALPVSAETRYPSETYDSSADHRELFGVTYFHTAIHTEVGWFGSEWDTTDGGWEHDMRSDTGCATEEQQDYTVMDCITEMGHGLDWSDPDFASFNIDFNDTSCGVTPLPPGLTADPNNSNLNWDDAALELVKAVVSGIIPIVGDFDSAVSVVSALIGTRSEFKYNFDFNDHFDYGSDYGGSCDTHRNFEPITDGSSTLGTAEVQGYCRSINCTPRLTTYISLDIQGSDPPPDYDLQPSNVSINSQDVKKTSTETFMFTNSDGTRLEYIPVGKIRERGRTLGWSKSEIEEKLDENRPIYFSHTSPIRSVETGSELVYDEDWRN